MINIMYRYKLTQTLANRKMKNEVKEIEPLLSFRAIAEILDLSHSRIYQLKDMGMPVVEVGRRRYKVRCSEVMEWLDSKPFASGAANE
jgi:predicted DNA-binding transcriptional regulator AlpA